MRLLLAEDEKEMSAALSAILTHSGYDVDAVYDGQAAVEKALSQSYDCMIFDIMMPKKDGVQALKEIRDKGNMTPVIMLTAKAEIDDRITGLDAGADDYLTKPFAMGELLARLRSLTRRSTSYAPSKLTVGNVELDVEEQELAWKAKKKSSRPCRVPTWSLSQPAWAAVPVPVQLLSLPNVPRKWGPSRWLSLPSRSLLKGNAVRKSLIKVPTT